MGEFPKETVFWKTEIEFCPIVFFFSLGYFNTFFWLRAVSATVSDTSKSLLPRAWIHVFPYALTRLLFYKAILKLHLLLLFEV